MKCGSECDQTSPPKQSGLHTLQGRNMASYVGCSDIPDTDKYDLLTNHFKLDIPKACQLSLFPTTVVTIMPMASLQPES